MIRKPTSAGKNRDGEAPGFNLKIIYVTRLPRVVTQPFFYFKFIIFWGGGGVCHLTFLNIFFFTFNCFWFHYFYDHIPNRCGRLPFSRTIEVVFHFEKY